jgi:hypothetical protein
MDSIRIGRPPSLIASAADFASLSQFEAKSGGGGANRISASISNLIVLQREFQGLLGTIITRAERSRLERRICRLP